MPIGVMDVPTGWRYKDEDSPVCPTCGCRDAEIILHPIPGDWTIQGRARCRNCGECFGYLGPPGDESDRDGECPEKSPAYRVVRPRLRCPQCASTDYRTSCTRPESASGSVVRYHVCRHCDYRFSSIER